MIADIKKSAEDKMKKSVEALRADFGKVRTGRAHTGILDHGIVGHADRRERTRKQGCRNG